MRASSAARSFAVAFLAWSAIAQTARADGADEDRLRSLEEALREQTEATERLRRDFEGYRARNPDASRMSSDEVTAAVDAYLASSIAQPALVATQAPSGIRWG